MNISNPVTLVPLIFAFCQALNIAIPSKYKKFIPLVAVAAGAAIAFFTNGDYVTTISAAFAAVGFHSGVKNTTEIKDLFKGEENTNGDKTEINTSI